MTHRTLTSTGPNLRGHASAALPNFRFDQNHTEGLYAYATAGQPSKGWAIWKQELPRDIPGATTSSTTCTNTARIYEATAWGPAFRTNQSTLLPFAYFNLSNLRGITNPGASYTAWTRDDDRYPLTQPYSFTITNPDACSKQIQFGISSYAESGDPAFSSNVTGYLGGYATKRTDPEPPVASSMTSSMSLPTGWLGVGDTWTGKLQAVDPGLGMRRLSFQLSRSSSATSGPVLGGTDTNASYDGQCLGNHEECPYKLGSTSGTRTFRSSMLPSAGTWYARGRAEDPLGYQDTTSGRSGGPENGHVTYKGEYALKYDPEAPKRSTPVPAGPCGMRVAKRSWARR